MNNLLCYFGTKTYHRCEKLYQFHHYQNEVLKNIYHVFFVNLKYYVERKKGKYIFTYNT